MPSTYVHGTQSSQAKITVGTSATQLPSVRAREIWVTTDDANTGKVFVGDSTVTSTGGGNVFTKLQANQTMVVQANNPALFYIVGSAASQVVYVGVLS